MLALPSLVALWSEVVLQEAWTWWKSNRTRTRPADARDGMLLFFVDDDIDPRR